MNSLQHATREIDRFLRSLEPQVLCISGAWGVGKTYTWAKMLRDAIEKRTVGLSRYSYVSLFGLNNLDEVKQNIFDNIEFLSADENDFKDDALIFGKKSAAVINKGRGILAALPGVGGALEKVIAGSQSLLFSSVREQIICVDDLERRGANLRIKDILGLVSFLKEQRKCKIVLLLNDKELGDEVDEFNRQFEKVIDNSIVFSPSSSDALSIAISGHDQISDAIRDNCQLLKISNIRVLKKIERLARAADEPLSAFRWEIRKQAVHSIVIFAWCKFEPRDAPSIEYMLKRGRMDDILSFVKEEPASPEDEKWGPVLDEYRFGSADEFDQVLLSGINAGAFDVDLLTDKAKLFEERLSLESAGQSPTRAWELFRESFEENTDDVCDAMANAIKLGPKAVSLHNLNSSFELLIDLGREEIAHDALSEYIKSESISEYVLDEDGDFASLENLNSTIRSAISERIKALKKQPKSEDILKRIGSEQGWEPSDIQFLSEISDEEISKIIKSSRGRELRAVMRGIFRFVNVANPSSEMKKYNATVLSVAERIGRESRLNFRRIDNFRNISR